MRRNLMRTGLLSYFGYTSCIDYNEEVFNVTRRYESLLLTLIQILLISSSIILLHYNLGIFTFLDTAVLLIIFSFLMLNEKPERWAIRHIDNVSREFLMKVIGSKQGIISIKKISATKKITPFSNLMSEVKSVYLFNDKILKNPSKYLFNYLNLLLSSGKANMIYDESHMFDFTSILWVDLG